MYDPTHFKVTSSKSVKFSIPGNDRFRSRSISHFWRTFRRKIHFIVIHWPSRRGGEAKSRPKRIEAAKLSKSIVDSLKQIDKKAKVIIMGDFNDDPISPSIKDFLKARGSTVLNNNQMYNAMYDHFKKGIGTLAYRDQWNLFDQFILTPTLMDNDKNYEDFTFYKSVVFNKSFLKNPKGNYKGYPFRSYGGSNFIGGYSDHFPVYLFLVKKLHEISPFNFISFIFLSTFSQDTLKVTYYNLLNFPSSQQDRIDTLGKILDFIKPDIFVVNELTSFNGGALIKNIALNAGGTNEFQSALFFDGPDTDNLLFYNQNKLALYSQQQIPTQLRDISEYILYDKQLALLGDTNLLYFYSIHLKAGSSSTNEELRRQEAVAFK